MNIKQHPAVWMIVATVLTGTFAVSSKIALQYFDPLLLGGMRLILSAIGVAVLSWHLTHKAFGSKTMSHLVINGVMHGSYTLLYFIGLSESQAINAALLGLLIPIFIYIGSIVFLKEPFVSKSLIGAAVSLLGGITLVALPILESGSFGVHSGDLYLLLATIILSITILHTKQLYKEVTPHQILTYRMLIGGSLLLVASLVAQESFDVSGVPATGWLALAYAALVVGSLGLLLFYAALKYMKAEDSAAIFYVDPLVAVLASALVLNEALSDRALIAASLIVIGVLIAHPAHVHRLHFYHAPHHKENILRRLLDAGMHKLHLK